MAHQNHDPPQYATQPVNFNDSSDDFFNPHPTTISPQPTGAFTGNAEDGRKTYNDRSSVLTGWTSGITVPYVIPVNEQGQTHAEAIKDEYSARGSRLEPVPPLPDKGSREKRSVDLGGGDRKSVGPDSTGLSYIDENFRYYSSRGTPTPMGGDTLTSRGDSPSDAHDAPLVSNARTMDGRERRDLEYAEAQPPTRANFFSRFIDKDRDPISQRIERRNRGIRRQRHPFLVYILTVIMTAIMIYEIVENKRATGAPFAFKPQVNPMIGPASIELVTLGARFPPCMKLIPDVPPTMSINCANATSTTVTADEVCTIEDVCGFGGFHGKEPNQWFRFITPIFLHAGLVHLLLNMFAQITLSGQVERDMGTAGFFILYFAAGIFGNVLGGNFALVGRPSVGASGAIVGTLGVLWVDLIAHWNIEYKPVTKLIGHIINLIIVVGLGYVPGVDNFSHLGGLLMGLICGIILLPIISTTKRHRLIVWILRLAMIPIAIVLFVVLIRNFYTSDPSKACSWCRYLSCIPTSSNNCKGTGLTTTTVGN